MDSARARPGPPWLIACAALVVLPAVLVAQPVPRQKADFLFQRPWVTIAVKGGYALPREASDVFEFVREELTVDRGDFRSAAVGAEIAVRLTERLDLAVDLQQTDASTGSEFRDWVGEDDLPIRQTTRLTRRPVTATLRGYLLSRGRSIGSFAWVPNRWSPYAGVGGGLAWYTFEQEGEFVDYQTFEIFRDRFVSSGRGPVGHVLGGVEFSLSPRFSATTELRYTWGRAELDERAFEGFDRIDLAGARATVGLSLRL